MKTMRKFLAGLGISGSLVLFGLTASADAQTRGRMAAFNRAASDMCQR